MLPNYWSVDDIDDHEKQERIRVGAVAFILVMTGLTITIMLMAPSPNLSELDTFLVVMAFAVGLVLAGWIFNGRTRGERLVFAPQRWVLWAVSVTSALALSVVTAVLFFMPERLYIFAYWPVMIGALASFLFVPESTARQRGGTKATQ